MNIIKNLNSIVRFLLEVVLIVSIVYSVWNHSLNLWIKIGIGIVLPICIIIIWSIFLAPKSTHTLSGTRRVFLEIIIFSIALLTIYINEQQHLALGLSIVTVINTILIHTL